MQCTIISGCQKKSVAKGLCMMHYKRKRSNGNPLMVRPNRFQSTGTLKERFESKIEIVTESGCWIWMGSTDINGYGRISREGRPLTASRASFEIYNGKVPSKMYVLHVCDTPSCVNPHHLFLGTQRDNVLDCKKKNRFNHPKGESHASAKIREEDAMNIIKDPSDAKTMAQKYGVTRRTIYNIRSEETWKCLKTRPTG